METNEILSVHDVTDHLIWRFHSCAAPLTILRLHNLLYYAQAWNLVERGEPMFTGSFEAWVQGPVNKDTFERYQYGHTVTAKLKMAHVQQSFSSDTIPSKASTILEKVIEQYGTMNAVALENMVKAEGPWSQARGGLRWYKSCFKEITQESILAAYEGKSLPDARSTAALGAGSFSFA